MGSPLDVCWNDHKNNVTVTSKIMQHVWNTQHRIQWDLAKIIGRESKRCERTFKKAAFNTIMINVLAK